MTVGTFDPAAQAVTMTDAALRHFEKALQQNSAVEYAREWMHRVCLCA